MAAVPPLLPPAKEGGAGGVHADAAKTIGRHNIR
jgi:hypothetical protein